MPTSPPIVADDTTRPSVPKPGGPKTNSAAAGAGSILVEDHCDAILNGLRSGNFLGGNNPLGIQHSGKCSSQRKCPKTARKSNPGRTGRRTAFLLLDRVSAPTWTRMRRVRRFTKSPHRRTRPSTRLAGRAALAPTPATARAAMLMARWHPLGRVMSSLVSLPRSEVPLEPGSCTRECTREPPRLH